MPLGKANAIEQDRGGASGLQLLPGTGQCVGRRGIGRCGSEDRRAMHDIIKY
jgi:hypothetical protein